MAYTIVGDAAIISGSTVPSKPAAVFKGGDTDDALAIDALAAARVAANDAVGTITAWICPTNNTSTSAIVSFNDANVVEFIDFKLVAGKLTAACTDGTTAQWATAETTASILPHVWTHVALVQNGVRPALFVNGVRRAITDTVTTDLTEWFVNCDGIDKGWIGASSIGGAGAVGEEFVGGIGEVKYWNTNLTDDEILADYNGTHKSTNCIARYDMNTLVDLATGGGTYDASLVSDAYLTPTYNEFISKVRLFGALVADSAGFSVSDKSASVLFINAA